ncbi:hypothetical protein DCC62_28350 [candidate division KSB1 bacterium]|nr:MAG: hypothetical protein DCC62_28350 [candidate division KSB1 bacterium]
MKRTVFAAIAVSLMVLFVAACQQYQPEAKQTIQQKQMQVSEMIQDSSMVNAMMDNIASNSHMRMKMMQKMMHHAKADSTGMMQMCKTMMDDQEMHVMMMKMMGTGTMTNGGMMKHGKMQEKVTENNDANPN